MSCSVMYCARLTWKKSIDAARCLAWHRKLDVLQSMFSSKADICCLVETWQTEDCTALEFPDYSRHSVCRALKQRGPIRGGIFVYVAAHLSQHIKVWRVAIDSSYIWLRLSHVKVGGSEVYLCVYYIAPSSSTVHASNCPYDTLQNAIVDAQNAGGCIIVCGDINARTAEQDDYTRLADLQDFIDVPEEGAYLGADVPQRSNCDNAPTTGTWGEELLELCRSTELLIANGQTPGAPYREIHLHHGGASPQKQSVKDYFLVSAQHLSSVADMRVICDAQYCNLSRDMPYDSEKSDHFPFQLDLSCSITTPGADA